jgi:hypothetical protein
MLDPWQKGHGGVVAMWGSEWGKPVSVAQEGKIGLIQGISQQGSANDRG